MLQCIETNTDATRSAQLARTPKVSFPSGASLRRSSTTICAVDITSVCVFFLNCALISAVP